MQKRKLLSVIGARPQFVKAAMVAASLAQRPALQHQIVHTGQHFDNNMSEVFFRELGIPEPDFNLGIQGGRHGEMTGRMLAELERLMIAERPDVVIVYGDTNSTLAGALAAAKLEIPLAHVEAGLRSFNRMPEEINRVLTDHVTAFHFSVTDVSTRNLANEGITGAGVHQVGDVMYDCALRSATVAERVSHALQQFGVEHNRFALCTVHRAVNADDPLKLRCLIDGLAQVSRTLPVVLPVHPRTRANMRLFGILSAEAPNLKIVDPIGYLDMVRLERASAVIVTDSGGVQREAFFHGIPCVTFRTETEWTELVDSGWNVLVPLEDPAVLAETVIRQVGTRGADVKPYGEGDAADRISAVLERAVL